MAEGRRRARVERTNLTGQNVPARRSLKVGLEHPCQRLLRSVQGGSALRDTRLALDGGVQPLVLGFDVVHGSLHIY
jgi:hypothetical protein